VAFSSGDSTFDNIVIVYLSKICNKEEFIRTAKKESNKKSPWTRDKDTPRGRNQ